MSRWWALVALVSVGCTTTTPVRTQPELNSAIESKMATPPYDRALWGILIEEDDGTILYQHNAHSLLMPASNRKLFSAAAAADCLGLDHRLTTELWLDGDDVVLVGGGDPSLGAPRYGRDYPRFAPFIAALRHRGVGRVRDIVADVSAFDRWTIPGGWKVGNLLSDYASPVDALVWDENAIGDFAVSSGGWFTAQAFRKELIDAGIDVQGSIRIQTERRRWRDRVAVEESPFVMQLLFAVLKNSHNLYTEVLLKDIAVGAAPATYDAALAREREFLLNEVRVDAAEVRFVDGSGLAPDNLVTPAAIITMLRWMNVPERRSIWWTTLAAAGNEGTLRRRLTKFSGRLVGKTGTINGVNALSGIILRRNGHYRYFSILLNHHIGDSDAANALIDSIVELLD